MQRCANDIIDLTLLVQDYQDMELGIFDAHEKVIRFAEKLNLEQLRHKAEVGPFKRESVLSLLLKASLEGHTAPLMAILRKWGHHLTEKDFQGIIPPKSFNLQAFWWLPFCLFADLYNFWFWVALIMALWLPIQPRVIPQNMAADFFKTKLTHKRPTKV